MIFLCWSNIDVELATEFRCFYRSYRDTTDIATIDSDKASKYIEDIRMINRQSAISERLVCPPLSIDETYPSKLLHGAYKCSHKRTISRI